MIATVDATIGHTNFPAYANAVNATIQRHHQRISIASRRSGHNNFALVTGMESPDHGPHYEPAFVGSDSEYITRAAIEAAENFGFPVTGAFGDKMAAAISRSMFDMGLESEGPDDQEFYAARTQR